MAGEAGTGIRYMTLARLRELLTPLDGALFVTTSPVTGGIVLYEDEWLSYDKLWGVVNLLTEELERYGNTILASEEREVQR